MIKKLFSFLSIFAILFTQLLFGLTAEVNAGSDWTYEKAEHLAKRALYRVTKERVAEIYRAWSSFNAYKLISQAPDASEIDKYEADLENFLNTSDLTNGWTWNNYYGLAITRDPYDYKRKAHFMLEDIFSVSSETVQARDIIKWHRHLYDNTFDNYKDIVYDSFYYKAPTQYLNLLNSNTHNPNENFARELMQLFLMEQCPPLNPDCSNKNYSEADVNSLAYFITGFRSQNWSSDVIYSQKHHNNTPRTFLGETYQPNAVDPAKVVDFIFEKRKKEIADFIAWRYLKYYVYENPTQDVIDKYSKVLQNNNFEIEPLLRSIFTWVEFYSSKSMNEVRYKNPIELLLWGQSAYRQTLDIIEIPTGQLWSLGLWSYRPDGWIFGRAWMDKNAEWINESVINKWYGIATNIAFTWNEGYDMSHIVSYGDSVDTIINKLESRILTWAVLPREVKEEFKKIYTSSEGWSLNSYNWTVAADKKVKLLAALTMAQPEFFMQSGYRDNLTPARENTTKWKYDDKWSIVFLNFAGWADFLQMWAPTEDETYKKKRWSLALKDSEVVHLDKGYKLNKNMGEFYKYFQSGELKIINNVWIPNSTRAHNQAALKIAMGWMDNYWVSWKMFKDFSWKVEQIAFASTSPAVFRGWKSISIDWNAISFKPSNEVRSAKLDNLYVDSLKRIITSREYPSFVWETVYGWYKLNELSEAAWTPWNKNKDKFKFISEMAKNDIGQVYYLKATWWYDTHQGQEWRLNRQVKEVATNVSEFFEREKAAWRKVTIVWYSEFGRWVAMNGNGWTDHWEWGWVFILTNDAWVDFPSMSWNVDLAVQERNWLKHEVDVRAVWNGVLGWVFEEDMTWFFPNNPATGKMYNIYDYPTLDKYTNEVETEYETPETPDTPAPKKEATKLEDVEENKRPYCNIIASKTEVYPWEMVKFNVDIKNHYKVHIDWLNWMTIPKKLQGHGTYNENFKYGVESSWRFYRKFNESTTQTVKVTSKINDRESVTYECMVEITVLDTKIEEDNENVCNISVSKSTLKPGEAYTVTLTWKEGLEKVWFNSWEKWKGRWIKSLPVTIEMTAPKEDLTLKMYTESEKYWKAECSTDLTIDKSTMKTSWGWGWGGSSTPDTPETPDATPTEPETPEVSENLYCSLDSRRKVWFRERFNLDWKVWADVVSAKINDRDHLNSLALEKWTKTYGSPWNLNYDLKKIAPTTTYTMEVFDKDWNSVTCTRELIINYTTDQLEERKKLKEAEIAKRLVQEQKKLNNEKNKEYHSKYRSILDWHPKGIERDKKYVEDYKAKLAEIEARLAKLEAELEAAQSGYEGYSEEWQGKYDSLEDMIRAEYE